MKKFWRERREIDRIERIQIIGILKEKFRNYLKGGIICRNWQRKFNLLKKGFLDF